MGISIKGGNNGNEATVDENHRLHTESVSQTLAAHASEIGDGYNYNTGYISLTGDGTTSAMAYFKNNESRDIKIDAIAVGFKDSASGAGPGFWTIVRNPTTGTIISSPSAMVQVGNWNFGSQKTLTVDAYFGAEANTFTDGTTIATVQQSFNSRVFAGFNVVLPKGTSIGINVTTPDSNTAMEAYVAFVVHLIDPANSD